MLLARPNSNKVFFERPLPLNEKSGKSDKVSEVRKNVRGRTKCQKSEKMSGVELNVRIGKNVQNQTKRWDSDKLLGV